MNELRLWCLKKAGRTLSVKAATFLITNAVPSCDQLTRSAYYLDCVDWGGTCNIASSLSMKMGAPLEDAFLRFFV